MISLEQLRHEADAMTEQLITVRRDLHAHPELAFQEVRTAGVVANKLNELGYEVQTGVGKTGVVGLLEGAGTGVGKTLLLRFDMDALPIFEQVDVPFKSQTDGVMHACGHDAHTSIGLGVAELLARHREAWSGTAKFVFQPAEEIVGGALAMIQDGVLNDPKPDHTLSMHVWSMDELGKIGMTDGPTMAAADGFKIIVLDGAPMAPRRIRAQTQSWRQLKLCWRCRRLSRAMSTRWIRPSSRSARFTVAAPRILCRMWSN